MKNNLLKYTIVGIMVISMIFSVFAVLISAITAA